MKRAHAAQSYARWNAFVWASLACFVWWARRDRWQLDIVIQNGVKFLVSRQRVWWRWRTLLLGAQFIEQPTVPTFYAWAVQEAGLELARVQQGAESLLCIGVGAGTVLSDARRRLGYEAVGVESSARVVEMAKSEFGVEEPLVTSEGLSFLSSNNRVFDAAVIDVFDGQGATWSFLERVDLLRAKFVVFNVVVLDEDAVEVAKYAAAKLATRFGTVRAFLDNDPWTRTAKLCSNLILFATDGPLPVEEMAARVVVDEVGSPEWVKQQFVKWQLASCDQKEVCMVNKHGAALRGEAYDRRCVQRLRLLTSKYVPERIHWRAVWIFAAWLYLCWMRLTDPAKRATAHFGPRWVADAVRLATSCFGCFVLRLRWRIVYEDSDFLAQVAAKHGAIALASPHGAYPLASLLFGIPFFRCNPTFEFRVAAASPLFFVPIFREFALIVGLRDCSKATLEALLDAGCIVALNPGGIYEMVHAKSSGPETVYAQKNLGCFKLAVATQKPLLLVYGFGENQIYSTYPNALLELRTFIMRKARIGLPWISGRFGLSLGPFPVLPHPGTTITHVVKRDLIYPPPLNDHDEVNALAIQLFESYRSSLSSFFHRYKAEYLPKAVAEKGFSVVWLGDAIDSQVTYRSQARAGRGSRKQKSSERR